MILKRFSRAVLFIALFILNNLIFCSSNFILNDINHNCIWIKHESITDTINTNKIIDFLSENKINKVFLEIFSMLRISSSGLIFTNFFLLNLKLSRLNKEDIGPD